MPSDLWRFLPLAVFLTCLAEMVLLPTRFFFASAISIPLSEKAEDTGGTDAEALFHSHAVSRFRNIERVARRKLLQIHAATELASLRVPAGNQLEALKADRKGQHSIRINDQWRICLVWKRGGEPPRFWLKPQSEYDIRVADREFRAKLSPRIRVFQPVAG